VTYRSHRVNVGAQNLLDPVGLLEQFGHGTLVLNHGYADLGSLQFLELVCKELLETNVNVVSAQGAIISYCFDLNLLHSLVELSNILDSQVLETSQTGNSAASAHVIKDVALFLRKSPSHGVVESDFFFFFFFFFPKDDSQMMLELLISLGSNRSVDDLIVGW